MDFIIDRSTKDLYESLFTTQLKQLGDPISSGQIPVTVMLVDPVAGDAANGRIWEPVNLGVGWDWIRVSMGKGNLPLFAGTFTLTFGANTTAAIVYNPTALQIQNALNAIASISGVGGVTVENVVNAAGVSQSNFFLIKFNSNGARALLTGDVTNLAPAAVFTFGTLIEGTASRPAVQTFHFAQNPAAMAELTTNLPAANVGVTVLTTGGGGQNHKIRILLSPYPYEGAFTVTVGGKETGPIDYTGLNTDSTNAVKSQLEALTTVGANNTSVTKQAPGDWIVEFVGTKANTDMGSITASAAFLKVPVGKTGILYLNTSAMELLIGSDVAVTMKLEIEGLQTGALAPDKFHQSDITVLATILDPSSMVTLPAPGSSYTTTTSDNRYVHWRPDITGVTGGGATNLDGLVTAGGEWLNRMAIINNGGAWALVAGTDAEDGVSVVRPDDYNAGTNAYVWKKII